MNGLRLDGVETRYGASRVLQGISLEVPAGGVVGLVGRNGAGKSTLLKSVMGLAPPSAGRVSFDGEDLTGLPPHAIARKGIAYVPEDRDVFPSLTVTENLTLAARANGPGRLQARCHLRRIPRVRGACPRRAQARCRAASNRCWPSPAR